MGGCEVESAMVLLGRFPQSQLLSVECVDIRKKICGVENGKGNACHLLLGHKYKHGQKSTHRGG